MTLKSNERVVAAGSYDDPYTGSTVDHWQGHGSLIDVDHIVSLGNASFANDPLNLLPADAGANRQKGDGDAATWLPAEKSYRCEYVSRQVAVKAKYDLWVTSAEQAAAIHARCQSGQRVEDLRHRPLRVRRLSRAHALCPNGSIRPLFTKSSRAR